jgi:hypothetical protein
METQPKNHNDKVSSERVLEVLQELKALAEQAKKARETRQPQHSAL